MRPTTHVLAGLLVATLSLHVGAEGFSGNADTSLNQATSAASHSAGTALSGASVVAAVPLFSLGVAGNVVGDVSEQLWDAGNQPIGTPLPIADEIHTIGLPPNQALELHGGEGE